MLTVSVILKLCVIFLNLRLKLYTQDPVKAFENGEFSTDVEILLGSNGEEGLIVTQFLIAFEAMFDGSAANRSIGSTTGCTITEKAPTKAFSWLKAPTSAFTKKTQL